MSLVPEESGELGRPSVELERVTKRFGDVTAVRSLDLIVGAGEFFTLLGPSGCGKTTTLRMVAGFEEPTEGRVLIDGVDVEGVPPFKRPTNTVFQSYALFPHLSVEDNVAFGLRRKGVPRDQVRRRVHEELRAGRARRRVEAQAAAAVRWPAAARGAGSGAHQRARRAAARRAAGRPRPEAAQGPAGGAEAHPAGGRDHVRLRDARPGGSAHDVGPDRGHESWRRRAARSAGGGVRASAHRVRRRLHRCLQPDAGVGRRGERRPGGRAPRQRPDRAHAGRWCRTGGPVPHRGPAGEAADRPGRRSRRRPGARASRAWWSPRSTWVPPRRWSSSWPATCRSRCWCPTRTRPSDSGCQEPAHACGCRGRLITCTSSPATGTPVQGRPSEEEHRPDTVPAPA